MDARILFKNIFGKERNITKKDIEEKIIKVGYKESLTFECKTFKKVSKIDDKLKERNIIKPLVGFLNKFSSEGGILILGVDAKSKIPTNIVPINENLIKDEEQLRSWIVNNIFSIPFSYTFPSLEIEEVKISEYEKIFIIEIHPIDSNTVYISRFTDYAYIRKGDETQRISLIETLRLIEEKKSPRVVVNLDKVALEKNERNVKIKFKLSFLNKGNKPAYHLISLIGFILKKGNKEKVIIKEKGPNVVDVTSHNPDTLRTFQVNMKTPLYPFFPMTFGEFEIELSKESEVEMKININEEMSYSSQKFMISEEGIEEFQSFWKTYV